jgi:hypothetical protein
MTIATLDLLRIVTFGLPSGFRAFLAGAQRFAAVAASGSGRCSYLRRRAGAGPERAIRPVYGPVMELVIRTFTAADEAAVVALWRAAGQRPRGVDAPGG